METSRVTSKGLLIIAIGCLLSLIPLKILFEKAGLPPASVQFYLVALLVFFGVIFLFALIPYFLSRSEEKSAAASGIKAGEIRSISDWDAVEFYAQFKWGYYP